MVRGLSIESVARLRLGAYRYAISPLRVGNARRTPGVWQPLRLSPSRSYSTETSTENLAKDGKSQDNAESPAPSDTQKAELEAKKQEIIELKDRYLRSVADFRNLQDRQKRDMAAARDFAITKFARDLIESIDNLDRALSVVPPELVAESASGQASPQEGQPPADAHKSLKDLHNGLKMTERILMDTLSKHGLVRFDPAENAEKFDPNRHEATFMTKMEGKEDGTVFHTMQKGFELNGRIVRAAKVGVVKNT